MAEIDWEKCIDLANKRLRDVITAADKADAREMTSLMLSSMCSEESEFTENTKITLDGDQYYGIYFMFNCYKFHITKDAEMNSNHVSDLYHIWCKCEFFDGEETPMGLVYVNWLCGATLLEEKHEAFLTGEITGQEFEQYLWDEVNTCCSDWLEKNKEKISK